MKTSAARIAPLVFGAVVAAVASAFGEHSVMNPLVAATPVTLGSAERSSSECAVVHPGDRHFIVTWKIPGGTSIAMESRDGGSEWKPAMPGSAPATASRRTPDDAEFQARPGGRIVGKIPQFPSAAVVISRRVARGSEAQDFGFADDVYSRAVATAVAAGPREVVGAYVTAAGECRVFRLPRETTSSHAEAWSKLPQFPQGAGVAGIIAGVHDAVLIGAGGANFPDAPPWEGGKKVTHTDIFMFRSGAHEWRHVGKLPEPRGYAATAAIRDGVLVAGGENAERVFSSAFLLSWDGNSVANRPLPDLPRPASQMIAVVQGGQVYAVGGQNGTPRQSLHQFLRFDPQKPDNGWVELPPWPGPSRTLAVVAATGDWIYVVSGLELRTGAEEKVVPTYLRDAYRYHVARGEWEKLPELPWSATAAPSPAPVDAERGRVFVLGGVDGEQAGKLPREAGLPNDILFFDPADRRWRLWPQAWPESVVTSPAVWWNDSWVIPSGEPRGGVRTPSVWRWQVTPGSN